MLEVTNARLGEIADRISVMTTHDMTSGSVLYDIASAAPSTPMVNSSPSLSVLQPQSTVSSEPTAEPAHAASVSTNSEGAVQRVITLADGSILRFTANQVPAPPAVTFVASDILTLNGMWDDTSPHWSGESALTVNGTPIPIIYWKQVYSSRARGAGSSWKPGQWKALKTHVSNWRVSSESHVQHILLIRFYSLLLLDGDKAPPKSFGRSFGSLMGTI